MGEAHTDDRPKPLIYIISLVYSSLIWSTMYLPEDLVVKILSRVSAACLARSRCVSKGWKALIKDNRLAEKQSQVMMMLMLIDFRVFLVSIDFHEIHNNRLKVKEQFSLKDPLFSNSSKEVDIRDVFHCDGLLLCTTKDNRLVVWNPCSRETRWIQPRDTYTEFDCFALGKSSCNSYKILRVDQNDSLPPIVVKFEVYDFTSSSWRVVGKAKDWFIPRWKARAMSVKGNAYWLAARQEHMNGNLLIIFDFSTERFGSVSLPGNHFSYDVITLSVTREDEKLCMLATQSGKSRDIDVWIATKIERLTKETKTKNKIKSYGAASWVKFLSVGLANLNQPYFFYSGMNFLVDRENKDLVCCRTRGTSKAFIHVVGERKCIQVNHNAAKSKRSVVVSYVPSSVQINKVGVRKRKEPELS